MSHDHPTEGGIPILGPPDTADLAAPEGYFPWRSRLDTRMVKEVTFATVYDSDDFRHGTSCHMHLLMISKMAEMLDMFEQGILESWRESQGIQPEEAPKIVVASA